MVRLIPYVHSPEEDEGEQAWTIHVPVQPMPWPEGAEEDDDDSEATDTEAPEAP